MYAEENPECYAEIAKEPFWKEARQRRIKVGSSKWMVYQMLRPETRNKRKTAGLYYKIIDDLVKKRIHVDIMAAHIEENGIQNSYDIAIGHPSGYSKANYKGIKERQRKNVSVVDNKDETEKDHTDGANGLTKKARAKSVHLKGGNATETSREDDEDEPWDTTDSEETSDGDNAADTKGNTNRTEEKFDAEALQVVCNGKRKMKLFMMQRNREATMKVRHIGKDKKGRDIIEAYFVKVR